MIVSDSVKLESMGSDAIDKMIIYNHFNKKDDHSRNIIRHCKQKLFKLKDYIHTSYAKDVAKTFEKQLKLIVSDEIRLFPSIVILDTITAFKKELKDTSKKKNKMVIFNDDLNIINL